MSLKSKTKYVNHEEGIMIPVKNDLTFHAHNFDSYKKEPLVKTRGELRDVQMHAHKKN